VRPGTTIALAALLVLILGAATLQLFFLAREEGDPQPAPASSTTTALMAPAPSEPE